MPHELFLASSVATGGSTRVRDGAITIAALGDVHYGRQSQGVLQPILAQISAKADVLVLCGDLTDFGLPEEAALLAKDLAAAKIPTLSVLGNHDYEGGKAEEIKKVLHDVGVTVLDGETIEIHGVGFAGVKGFAGGFGRGTLGPWGEDAVKKFVNEAVQEALKLETALARLRTRHKIAVLHYSPIHGTCEGEPPEIMPWLGTSRLEEPIDRYEVAACFHGHAHNGRPEGATARNTPVYNVSLPLLRRVSPDQPFCTLTLPA
jgi:Icc-related predicted phosphoesterase